MPAYTTSISVRTLRAIARFGSLTIGLVALVFSLIMGSQDYGGGLMGIIKNAPNAWPWLVMLLATLLAWRREFLGGALLTALGLYLVYFFNFSGPNFWWSTFILTSTFPLLGTLFLTSWYLNRNHG